ncbi:MAG TPA: site-specific integrase [Deltaproteobacteria bacterium]|nr:site-specific integrase [Deltaproteobacteria bacterium]
MDRPSPIEVGPLRARAVRPRGVRGPHDGRWYWRGEQAREMVWRGWATRDEASMALARILVELPRRRPSQLSDVRTVRELCEAWHRTTLEGRTDLSPYTLRSTRQAGQRISAGLGAVRLDRLGGAVLEEWVGARRRRGNATLSIQSDLQILGRIWRWGQAVGAAPPYDLALPRIRTRHKRPRYTPTLPEVAAVVRELEASAPLWTSVAVQLATATGARIGEIATLVWERVDLEAGLVELVGKTGPRTVPLRAELVALLGTLPRHSAWVLGVAPATCRNIRGHLGAACDRAGVQRFTPHALRRLAVDRLARAGVDVGTAAAVLGHSPAVMLSVYRQVGLDERRAAIDALERLPRGEVIELSAHRSGRSPQDE